MMRVPNVLKRRRPFRDESGAAGVEFAIIAPVFILLIMGMIAYGFYFAALHSLQQIAADAARASIAGLDQAEREALVQAFIEENAGGYAFIDARKLAVEIGSASGGAQLVVSVNYGAENLPIWGLLEGLPLPGKVIHRSATIRIGGL